MKYEIAAGVQDFETIRVCKGFYVDKTEFIQDWWKGLDTVTLITRPRRFGKTLNMSTLNCFFSNKYASRSDLFEGLKVWKDPDMQKEQGKWPVIFMSFAGIKGTNYDAALMQIKTMITALFSDFPELYRFQDYDVNDRKALERIEEEMSDERAALSIQLLSRLLYKIYGRKVLIFLDEYDTPLQEAYINGYWDKLVSFMRTMFNTTFKTNPFLERAVMTGITRVSKESIFSDLNNLVVVTTTSDLYATAFGFTEEEVFTSLDLQGFGEEDKQDVKTWYDGFTFGKVTDIYNPWSVTNYLNSGKLDTYWANTSGNGLVSRLIGQGAPEIKCFFEDLMNGGKVKVPVDEQIIFSQLDTNADAVWSLLLATGYLKVVSVTGMKEAVLRGGKRIYTLMITNLEVLTMFQKMFQDWFAQTKGLSKFAKALLQGDEESMEEYLNELMRSSMSYFDGGEDSCGRLPENFYHGLVLGLLADNTQDYEVTSNRESGFGRYDVIMAPKSADKPAAILEFKVFNPRRGENSLEDTAANALKQIEEKHYDAGLLVRGIPKGHILKYGFAFREKECLILKAK